MSSTYQDKELDKSTSSTGTASTSLSKTIGATVSGGSTASSGSSGTGTSSTNSYASRVKELASSSALTYTPGDSVTSAKSYLDSVIANKPGSYEGKYTSQLSSLYDQIMNRQKFSYNMNSDAMYAMYANRYKQQGLKNMRDTMGQANANTGGYGSSYAQTAGQDAYNSEMSSLAEQGTTLQSNALSRYNDETTRLNNLYSTVQSADSTDYSRYQDQYNNWQNERTYAANAYDQAYSNDYTQYQNDLSTGMNLYSMEREDATNEQSNAQEQAQMYIQAGIMPSADLIAKTGWDTASVQALVKKYK